MQRIFLPDSFARRLPMRASMAGSRAYHSNAAASSSEPPGGTSGRSCLPAQLEVAAGRVAMTGSPRHRFEHGVRDTFTQRAEDVEMRLRSVRDIVAAPRQPGLIAGFAAATPAARSRAEDRRRSSQAQLRAAGSRRAAMKARTRFSGSLIGLKRARSSRRGSPGERSTAAAARRCAGCALKFVGVHAVADAEDLSLRIPTVEAATAPARARPSRSG